MIIPQIGVGNVRVSEEWVKNDLARMAMRAASVVGHVICYKYGFVDGFYYLECLLSQYGEDRSRDIYDGDESWDFLSHCISDWPYITAKISDIENLNRFPRFQVTSSGKKFSAEAAWDTKPVSNTNMFGRRFANASSSAATKHTAILYASDVPDNSRREKVVRGIWSRQPREIKTC